MINFNLVDPVIDKSQLQKTTADVIYKQHQAEINDIYGMILEKAEQGEIRLKIFRQYDVFHDPSWIVTFFKLKGFNSEMFVLPRGIKLIEISWA